jgi:hypothetical protein
VGVRYRIGVTLLNSGRLREAMAALEGTRSFFPENWSYWMAHALLELDRKPEATRLIDDFLRDNPRDEGGVGNAMRALLHADAGQAELAERQHPRGGGKGPQLRPLPPCGLHHRGGLRPHGPHSRRHLLAPARGGRRLPVLSAVRARPQPRLAAAGPRLPAIDGAS